MDRESIDKIIVMNAWEKELSGDASSMSDIVYGKKFHFVSEDCTGSCGQKVTIDTWTENDWNVSDGSWKSQSENETKKNGE